ncbi:MAG: hypothetical protein WBD66_05705, partial [Candidatus Acidiferrales bacterium]
PADRVEIWEHEIYQSSGYSPEEPSWDMVWSLIPRLGASKRLTSCTGRLPNLNRYSRAAIVQQ